MNTRLTQEMSTYNSTDFEVWKILFERQNKNLENKGSKHYLKALKEMKAVLNAEEVPDFRKLNDFFSRTTSWEIAVVPGLIPVEEFFDLLAEKKFCSSTWLRSIENLDYLEEPDMFHDIFGHIPLLSNPIFSAFAHEFGKMGQKMRNNELALIQLQRLYWFTIEFGVIREDDVKSYGAGIMSSFGETNRIHNNECSFLPFDIEMILHKQFWTDRLQEEYVVINSLDELYNSLSKASQIIETF